MKAKISLLMVMSVFALSACTKSGSGAGDSSTNAAGLNCAGSDSKVAKVDPDSLRLSGSNTALPGETVRYKINQDMSCSAQAVTWKMIGQSPALQTEKIKSTFENEGQWVVTAKVMTAASPDAVEVSALTVVTSDLTLTGPQIGMAELVHHFELAIPAGAVVSSVAWNFGDGTAVESGSDPKDHTYYQPGNYTVSVTVHINGQGPVVLSHPIKVLPPTDGMECVRDLVISGPTKLEPGQSGNFTAYIPQCLTWQTKQVRWNFGDGTLMLVGNALTHSYESVGEYTVRVDLFTAESKTPFLTITIPVSVQTPPAPTPNPTPVPDPVPVPDPGPTPAPYCRIGEERTSFSETFTEQAACGVGGSRTDSYRNRIVERCVLGGDERLKWVQVSSSKEQTAAGQCENVACELPPQALEGVDLVTGNFIYVNGKYYLPHGASKTFYSTRRPAGACSEVAERRTCENGVIGGAIDHVYLSCDNGCPGVGPHGSTVTNVVTGQEQVPKQCQFGETGAVDIYQTLSDKTCDNGQVLTSNAHRGGLITAGQCPTYSWTPGDSFTACTAACGGEQTQIFNCRNDRGESAPLERCTGSAPVVKRVCDGDPESVRRSESSTKIEEAGQSGSCPANQIGYTLKKREVTTTKNFACIDHSVKQESENVTNGPWLEEKFCKDYAPHRCSQDPMSEEEARGRFEWMKKCSAQVPMIHEFLAQYDHSGGKLENLTYKGNIIYASFMDKSTTPEKKWIAPKSKRASCSVPAHVYIAAICVVDCATPEQPVMAQARSGGHLEYIRFENAWNEKFKFVATLGEKSTLESKLVSKTPVDQWVQGAVEDHTVIEFTMQSGFRLRVTPGHPLVDSSGRMREAREFKVGETLTMLGGQGDGILSVETKNFRGRVYNIYVKADDVRRNIIVINGYLSGTAYYAGPGIDQMNRMVLRSALTQGVFD